MTGAMLVPFLIALFYFSTEIQRKSPIFRCVSLGVAMGIVQAIQADYILVNDIRSPRTMQKADRYCTSVDHHASPLQPIEHLYYHQLYGTYITPHIHHRHCTLVSCYCRLPTFNDSPMEIGTHYCDSYPFENFPIYRMGCLVSGWGTMGSDSHSRWISSK